jgi:hypothetical protein
MSPIYVPGKVVLANGQPYPVDLQGIGSVSLLLHGDGTNGSTTITDSSPRPKTVTAVGNAQISTAQSKFGGASIGCISPSGQLSVAASQEFAFDSGNFTIEFWYYPTTDTEQQSPFTQYTSTQGIGSHGLFLNYATNTITWYLNGNASTRITQTGGLPALNAWTHIAGVRDSGVVKLYFNGVALADQETILSSMGKSDAIFEFGSISAPLVGYIDDIRITKGIARYTANFTPPTLPFPDF